MSAALRVGLHRVHIPLRVPHVAAHGTEDVREVVLVSVTDAAGVTGWGECPTLAHPGYGSEWTEQAWGVLVEEMAPRVAATGRAAPVPGHPMAGAAVADALVDRALRARGEGPDAVLGPLAPTVAWGAALSLCPPGGEVALIAAAREQRTAGASLLVLKVRPGQAVEPLAALVGAGLGIPVAVDANGSFTADDRAELEEIAALGPAYVEQPCAAEDLTGSAALARSLAVPIALDESITDADDLDRAVALGAGAILTLKPARAGGVEAAVALALRAASAGWSVQVGGMLESGVGRAGARLVAARPEVGRPSLVGPSVLHLVDDVVAPPRPAEPGPVAVWRGPGLVPTPDPERLRRLRVDHWRSS